MCIFGSRPIRSMNVRLPESLSPDGLDLWLPLPDERDLGEVVIGWRRWSFGVADRVVGSYGQTWNPGEVMVPRFGTVTARNSAGVYAYKGDISLGYPLHGEVLLWGKVYEYEKGYRAEYAYPLSFFVYRDRLMNVKPWVKDGVYVNVYNRTKATYEAYA